MLKVTDVGKSVKAFTGIKQAKEKPYMQFIDRLEMAIDKQVENDAAKDALLLKLAIENANSDGQKVLHHGPWWIPVRLVRPVLNHPAVTEAESRGSQQHIDVDNATDALE
ncbi:hypothetical protein AAES_158001 [Amazona aestiva]|uniref:Retroviral nucleocapsid Gag protein p24 C-terminal domain-containing protein n=1 Tax=Amazona aestiva TaxID=12930 RepID=A0A0Q3LUN5_AMAAE|nr:hypothetical protein AAES_158001 [Amazona aestiva]